MLAQNCRTSFLAAAQATPGLDFLVQAIQRGNLADTLPAAGSGATVFAPNNDAFTNMLQTLSAHTNSREAFSRQCLHSLSLSETYMFPADRLCAFLTQFKPPAMLMM